MNAVTTPPSKPKEQRFIQTGVSWEGFKAIQKGFADSPGVRLFYYKGEVEILGVSPDHESISRMITGLLIVYFLEKEIEFNPLGSFTQEKEEEVSAQADESFAIGSSTATTPDLSVEVIFTSGSDRKLNRYQVLGVPEVGFWEDGVFRLYHLRESGYERIEASEVLRDLDIKELSRSRIVKQCRDLPGYELFQYFDENGECQTISSEDVNAYLQEITGEEFTAKDFRNE